MKRNWLHNRLTPAEHLRLRTCGQKVPFYSKAKATRRAKHLNRNRRMRNRGRFRQVFRIYQCPYGPHWHLTREEKKVKQRRREKRQPYSRKGRTNEKQ